MEYRGFQDYYSKIDLLIRLGDFKSAQQQLRRIKRVDVPSRHLPAFCQLLRRVGMPETSLRHLKDVVYPKVGTRSKPASKAIIEYARALQKVGAMGESARLLNDKADRNEPEYYMAAAASHIFRWNYLAAIPMLQKYLTLCKPESYEGAVGGVNLLSCYCAIGHSDFDKLYLRLKQDLAPAHFALLAANVDEIAAQFFVENSDWNRAKESLTSARRLAQKVSGVNLEWIEKWEAILQAMQKRNATPLDSLRVTMLKAKNWQALRHIDYFNTLLNPDCRASNWVFYGTPFLPFRQRLKKLKMYAEESWVSLSSAPSHWVDPRFVDKGNSDVSHRMMVYFLRDFYRPFRTGEIAADVLGVQRFDLQTTANRVHVNIRRFKTWLSGNKLPFRLDESDGGYALRANANVAILCRQSQLPVERARFVFGRFEAYIGIPMPVDQWADLLRTKIPNARVLLKAGVAEGFLKFSRRGAHSCFELTQPLCEGLTDTP